MLNLNEIMAACEALDDCLGPQGWRLEGPDYYGLYSVYDGDGNRFLTTVEEKARFIARARTWLPALVEELTQACEELAAVDESLGEFYAPVLDPETEEPCGSFWKDHGVWTMREELEHAQAELAAVDEALGAFHCAGTEDRGVYALRQELDNVLTDLELARAEVKRLRAEREAQMEAQANDRT